MLIPDKQAASIKNDEMKQPITPPTVPRRELFPVTKYPLWSGFWSAPYYCRWLAATPQDVSHNPFHVSGILELTLDSLVLSSWMQGLFRRFSYGVGILTIIHSCIANMSIANAINRRADSRPIDKVNNNELSITTGPGRELGLARPAINLSHGSFRQPWFRSGVVRLNRSIRMRRSFRPFPLPLSTT